MLENTFMHLPGVGPETEQRLWASGCQTWTHLEERMEEFFKGARRSKVERALEDSRAALAAGSLHYFGSKFRGGEKWRLLPSVFARGESDKIAYLDIETTGLGFPPASESTTIAVLFDGELFVEHEPARKRNLLERLEAEARLLVTFNGLTFDLPFLRREFNLAFAQAHVDLRYWFANLGWSGGLKRLQTSFPEIHQRVSMDIDGFDAVRLWRLHERGVARALETLMTYNAEDTIVLEQLVYKGLNIEAERRAEMQLPTRQLPPPPRLATEVCPHVYRLLRRPA